MTAPEVDHVVGDPGTLTVVVGRTGVAATSPRKLRAARETAGLTQDEVARRLSASSANVRAWESGSRRPDVHNLVRLAQVYGVPAADLLTDGIPRDMLWLRVCVGRTQQQVADLAGMSRARYAALERAERPLRDPDVAAVATALCDPDRGVTVTADQVRDAYAVTGVDWPIPGRPVELPGEVAARVAAVRRDGESFAEALARVIEAGLGESPGPPGSAPPGKHQ